MSDNTLSRLRDSVQRLRSGDPSARPELEEGLREVARGEYAEALSRWEAARARGESPAAEELCPGRPESVPTVKEVIRLVEDAHSCLTETAATPTVPSTGAPATAADGPLPSVPGYELLGVLGRGGMGVVYKARQLGFNRVVALKMVRAGAGADPAERARFRVEAEAVARLRHPNIVQVHDIGEVDGCPYFSMEHVEGGSLARGARGEPPAPRRAAEVVEALARAMHHAHQSGVVHRDLKPSNVLLEADGTPKVADFGLAKLLDLDVTRTASEAVLGTACYMAPEQASGRSRDVGPAADVYGLGAILYELLTSRPPVERGPWEVMLERVRTQDPVAPRRLHPALSRDLEAVCLKCLEKDPRQRYPSAGALADDLRRWLEGRPTVARPLSWAGRVGRAARRHPFAAAAVLLLLIAAAAVPVAAHYLDPDRVPKDNAKQLGRGRRVTLIGETGPPRWVKHVMGSPAVEDPPAHDGTFAIRSGRTAYLELLPAAPAGGYRFRVKVRHEASDRTGEVGIYFARREVTTARGAEHALGVLRFNDRYAGEVGPDGNRCEFLALEVRRCRTPDHFEATAPPVAVEPFTPAVLTRRPGEPPPWRELAVEVAPEEVRVLWEGRKVATVPRQRLADLFREELNGPDLPGLHEPTWSPSFAPAGGLGLVLGNGWASWKGAEVEPLDASAP